MRCGYRESLHCANVLCTTDHHRRGFRIFHLAFHVPLYASSVPPILSGNSSKHVKCKHEDDQGVHVHMQYKTQSLGKTMNYRTVFCSCSGEAPASATSASHPRQNQCLFLLLCHLQFTEQTVDSKISWTERRGVFLAHHRYLTDVIHRTHTCPNSL